MNVAVLRRARVTERTSAEPRRRLARLAAAAAAIAWMVLLPTHTSRRPLVQMPIAGSNSVVSQPPLTSGFGIGDGPAPLIEPLDLPAARIYQLGEEDLSVVMVVDESIDV